jgi:hypothetical protein
MKYIGVRKKTRCWREGLVVNFAKKFQPPKWLPKRTVRGIFLRTFYFLTQILVCITWVTTASLYLSYLCLQVILNEAPWLVKAASVASSDHSGSSGYPSNAILPPHPHVYQQTNSLKKYTTTLLKMPFAKTASPHLHIPNEFETPP